MNHFQMVCTASDYFHVAIYSYIAGFGSPFLIYGAIRFFFRKKTA